MMDNINNQEEQEGDLSVNQSYEEPNCTIKNKTRSSFWQKDLEGQASNKSKDAKTEVSTNGKGISHAERGNKNVTQRVRLEILGKEPQEKFYESRWDIVMNSAVDDKSLKLQNPSSNLQCVYIDVPLTETDDWVGKNGINSREDELFPENEVLLPNEANNVTVEKIIDDPEFGEGIELIPDGVSIDTELSYKINSNMEDEESDTELEQDAEKDVNVYEGSELNEDIEMDEVEEDIEMDEVEEGIEMDEVKEDIEMDEVEEDIKVVRDVSEEQDVYEYGEVNAEGDVNEDREVDVEADGYTGGGVEMELAAGPDFAATQYNVVILQVEQEIEVSTSDCIRPINEDELVETTKLQSFNVSTVEDTTTESESEEIGLDDIAIYMFDELPSMAELDKLPEREVQIYLPNRKKYFGSDKPVINEIKNTANDSKDGAPSDRLYLSSPSTSTSNYEPVRKYKKKAKIINGSDKPVTNEIKNTATESKDGATSDCLYLSSPSTSTSNYEPIRKYKKKTKIINGSDKPVTNEIKNTATDSKGGAPSDPLYLSSPSTSTSKNKPVRKYQKNEKITKILPARSANRRHTQALKNIRLQNASNTDMLTEQKPEVRAVTPGTSKPIHIQRVINATSLDVLKQSYEPSREVDSDISDEDDEVVVDDESVEAEREQSDDGQNEPEFRDLFNFDNCDSERSWLTSVFQENAHDVSHLDQNYLLQQHAERKKIVFTRERCMRSMYYSVGLLSTFDKYPEIKKIRGKPPKKKVPKEDIAKSPHYSTFSDVLDDGSNDGGVDLHFDGDGQNQDEDSSINSDLRSNLVQAGPSGVRKKKARTFKDEESKKKWEDVMTLKRKKVFTSIVKKEVSKQHRAKMNKHKEMLIQCKRVALQCQKVVRQKALHSARVVKEQQWRMKRLARENLAYWKRSKRVDREIRRKLEKEAEEQRKMDFEFIEAKRQQRKLNFLITQTELYAHFMSKKLGTGSPEEQLRILNQLDEEKNPRLANIDDYDSDLMKAKAMRNAEEAFQNEKARTKNFDVDAHCKIDIKKTESIKGEHPQPAVFRGNLKGYQLKGMNWLANLYDQGISGILADEMGLGKTVQSIAFLCHIAEKYSVWGPFLIISPASTLHNWQQEIAKFVPDFKVVPYWGNPNERKILRQFWDQKDMHTKDASFHIVVTSYQIVITDIKYFNRIKWQYMILDEAQAIKSTSSMRWKTLLGFSCRNRLLLSGTPIQNSMAELWALLHFIMPTLFDSHEEFNEWFSKDIESHAENKTGIDEKHLSRLHMILKPFMLRRIKKDVENELSDKIEVMVYCPLTTRQKLLYMALKQKIRIEDLLHYTVGGGDSHTVDKNFTSNLMNLVMQFRKVCNHPELFERRDAKSPIYIPPLAYEIPYLVYDSNVRQDKFRIIQKYFSFTPEYIAHAIRDYFKDTIFNFARAFKLSIEDLFKIFAGDILHRWKNYYEIENCDYNSCYRSFWSKSKDRPVNLQRLKSGFKMAPAFVEMSQVLQDLTFTWKNSGQHVFYTHARHAYYSMPETVEHKNIRSKTVNVDDSEPIIDVVNDDPTVKSIKELPYEERAPQMFDCERTLLPSFLFSAMPKLETTSPMLYCYSRKAAWDWKRFIDDYSWNSLQYHWCHSTDNDLSNNRYNYVTRVPCGPVDTIRPANGWSHIAVPDKETLVTDSGKLSVLDGLLKRLKEEGHRVLIYSQMTKMIDLLEEYMWHRHHKYMRLDGSSKISERRDMVADFQARTDIFVFLLSTRAGGLGINLTAADTVIFYDSDWNPTVDQQAMDRAHRLGQTKQVTVYRLICKGSIEERILQRAREKSEIQKLVISGGNFKPDTLKPKEVVSLLLDDEEIEQKYRQRTEERKQVEDMREIERKRKHMAAFKTVHVPPTEVKKLKQEGSESGMEDQWLSVDSGPSSPHSDNSPVLTASEDVNDGNFLDVEGDASINSKYTVYNLYGSTVKPRIPGRGSSKRGRPRGSRRVSALGRFNSNASSTTSSAPSSQELVTDLNASPSTSGLASFDLPSASTSPSFPSQGSTTTSGYSGSPTVRRGPGRPRLKPGGPPHAGSRGPYRPRKPARPLPVPLPSDGGGNTTVSNVGYSSYLYDYPEQPSDS